MTDTNTTKAKRNRSRSRSRKPAEVKVEIAVDLLVGKIVSAVTAAINATSEAKVKTIESLAEPLRSVHQTYIDPRDLHPGLPPSIMGLPVVNMAPQKVRSIPEAVAFLESLADRSEHVRDRLVDSFGAVLQFEGEKAASCGDSPTPGSSDMARRIYEVCLRLERNLKQMENIASCSDV